MLEVENIRSGYGAIRVLYDVSLGVQKGEIVGIIGANGAGKTTLVRCISRLIPLRKGRIRFEGREIEPCSPDQLVNMGLIHVPEGRRIFAPLTVLENLIIGCYSQYEQLGAQGRERLLQYVYGLFPILYERREQKGGSLSGGEQQMLAIGRALMAEPKLLILDEPSLGLSPLVSASLCETFANLNKKGITLLLVEQNARLALNLSNRIFVLENGRVVASGTSQDFSLSRLKELYIT